MNPNPKHIAIILDGNRRYARRHNLELMKGHELGFEKIKKLFRWCKELEIKELTLYCFSMQNFSRSKEEVSYLMELLHRASTEILKNKDVHKNKIKIRFIGRMYLLPKKLQEAMKKAEEATRNYSDYAANFAIAYGGREEITDAVKNIAEKISSRELTPKEINEDLITKNLYLSSSPDIVIRTGGEMRTSNFLMWQSNYSEWFFINKMWPEFEKKDMADIIEEYKNRDRRYGK
jgi:tritrans,polycis-undecaprenyl-diphosphate synthase [geranylgeranyl-diphosphate specific]